MPEKYLLICNNCGNKSYSDGKGISFVEVPVAPVPKRGNGVDKETKSVSKKLKCPECGYVFKVVKLIGEVKPEQPEETTNP